MYRTTVTCARFPGFASLLSAMAATAARFEDPSTPLLKLVGQHGLKSTTAEDIIRMTEPLEEAKDVAV